jgi:LPXTG-motif cell wall-anchored protein
MNPSQIYVLIGLVVLAIIAVLIFVSKKQKPSGKLSQLAALSFGFIIAGIIFGENRLVGYGLMAIGVILAVIDSIRKAR